MPDELMGQRVKELVRRYFMEGMKSSNKLYTPDLEGTVESETTKAVRRKNDQYGAEMVIYDIKHSFKDSGKSGSANYAKSLLQRKAEVRAGNCGEMADLAAYLANEYEHVPANQIYIGVLAKPGEHVFCLIADAAIPPANHIADSLSGFCGTAPNYLIIDPWLNTACLSRAYIRETEARLRKWEQDGKRIHWSGRDGTLPGWYPPDGDYKHAMQAARVDLYPYS